MHNNGFTLIEVAIVLVVSAIIVAGVLGGKSLIRAAELRAIVNEYENYSVVISNFKHKYRAIPGDMRNATFIWGSNSALCSETGNNREGGVCNGNGDGNLGFGGSRELWQFWTHLSAAGMIEGQYSGKSGPNNTTDSIIGVNVPASRIANTGWTARNCIDDLSIGKHCGPESLLIDYGNNLNFGRDGVYDTDQPALSPAEARNIDLKIDDGYPGTGNIIATFWDDLCYNADTNIDITAEYRVQDNNILCGLIFRGLF